MPGNTSERTYFAGLARTGGPTVLYDEREL
jgi:hypothetical protein